MVLYRLPLEPAAWQVVNDGVMGGVSSAQVVRAPGAAVALRFSGHVSLDYGGGFASARVPLVLPPDAADATAMVARVRGDGRRYRLTAFVRAPGGGRAAWHYQAPFETSGSEQTLELPLAGFVARFRGRPVGAGPLAARDVVAAGLQISDRQAGPFSLEVFELAFVMPHAAQG